MKTGSVITIPCMELGTLSARFCTMSESKTTSDWNWEVIRGGEAGRRGARC